MKQMKSTEQRLGKKKLIAMALLGFFVLSIFSFSITSVSASVLGLDTNLNANAQADVESSNSLNLGNKDKGTKAETKTNSNTNLAINSNVNAESESGSESSKNRNGTEFRSQASVGASAFLKAIIKARFQQSNMTIEDFLLELIPNETEIDAAINTSVNTSTNTSANTNTFILWTSDGDNVLWAKYIANGYFKGEDNNGKTAFGILYKGTFAGFYNGELFYGRYTGNHWKAKGLFGLETSSGGLAALSNESNRKGALNSHLENSVQTISKVKAETELADA